jgi:hypothetical protein
MRDSISFLVRFTKARTRIINQLSRLKLTRQKCIDTELLFVKILWRSQDLADGCIEYGTLAILWCYALRQARADKNGERRQEARVCRNAVINCCCST